MKLLIRSLMPRPKLAFRLYPGLERWILNALKVNDLPKKMTRTPRIMKRISLPRIFLLMHHQVGHNPFWHSQRKTRTVVLVENDSDNKAKTRILLPLASTPPSSGKTRTRIRTRKTYLTLSAILVSRKVIMPTSIPRKSKKTSVGLNNLHVGD